LRAWRRETGRELAEALARGPSTKRMCALHIEVAFRLGDWLEERRWDTVEVRKP
jgi:hypothetical protein